MDIIRGSIVLFFIFFSLPALAVNAWVSKWIDGPATATYERTPTALRTYVNVPSAGGHVEYTLNSNPTKSWSSGSPTGSGSFGPASTATTPKIATNVKIPILPGAAVGSAVAATLTMVIPKASLAKAAVALVRANPYVSAAVTLGWLANAGYQYFKDTDTFTQDAPQIVPKVTGYSADKGACISQYLLKPDALACASSSLGPLTFNFFDPPYAEYYIYGNGQSLRLAIQPNSICPAGYTFTSAGICDKTTQLPAVPVDFSQVEASLPSVPVYGTQDTAQGFDDQLSELVKHGYNPEPDESLTPQLTGSTVPIQGPKTTTVTPTGDVITQNTTYTNTYTNNYVDTVATTVTNTIPASGPAQVTTITGPVESQVLLEQKTDCDKYPNSLGCTELGLVPASESLPVTVIPANFSYTSWGAGSCPVSQSVAGITFSYQPYCEKLIQIKPLIMVFGLIISLFIIIGPVRDS